ncbi:IS66 family transposase [Bacillus cereus]|uniref:IS66 family transposase n=1 Tax=Bacillus cereus TaxID=1396 RepID=UPI00211E6813|nr:transposase [Bacillus cereus]
MSSFCGIAMHDGWKSYDAYTDCRHVLCNAHLLRDLQGVIDKYWTKVGATDAGISNASFNTEKTIQRKHAKNGAKESIYRPPLHIERTTDSFYETKKERKAAPQNLWNRFVKYPDRILAFLERPDIPFDNNQAERDIRMTKAK